VTPLRELLHDHAVVPTRPLDVAAVVELAHRHRRRRVLVWLAGIGVGAGALVGPALPGALTAGSDGERVETVQPTPPSTVPEPAPDEVATVDVDVTVPEAEAPGDSAEVAVGSAVDPDVAADAATGPAAASDPSASPFGPAAPDEGCTVFSRPAEGTATAGPVAAPTEEPDAVRECSYVARRPGGYEGAGTWTLEIRRGGTTITFDSVRSPGCQVGVIEPGDVVHARLGVRDAPVVASAGEGEWHLHVGSWVVC
jgi:hypothetical protein